MKLFANLSPIVNMEKEESSEVVKGVDFSAFTKDGGSTFKDDTDKKTAKINSRKKASVVPVFKGDISDKPAVADESAGYFGTFSKTNLMLEGAIAQTDQLSAEVKEDIDNIRASKTLKNKYTYITNLTASSASLISTKIAAIKEINATIQNSHKLELDRLKMTKDAEKDQSDDSRMMDLYKAFVNTPVGTYASPNVPSVTEMTMDPMGNGISPITMGSGDLPVGQLTPEQARMRMESNPNIMTVVKFNQSTGQRFFDVIDRTNGASVPNYPRPDSFLLDDTNIDVHAMSARNKNLDIVWPLVFIGDGDISEY